MAKKVLFSDIFPSEYLDTIQSYKDRIQYILEEYDIAIFMARKAICFYKSMLINNEITENQKCLVISNRVLTYNVLKTFVDKKIAIIDDVVVKGTSIIGSLNRLTSDNIKVDVYIVAAEKEFIETQQAIYNINFIAPYLYLSQISIYQLSSYITEYIEASMCPYNIDQPIYNLEFCNTEALNEFLLSNKVTEITSGLQRKFNISSYVIHFKSDVLNPVLRGRFDYNKTFVKIRLMHKAGTNTMMAIPFILLPEMSREVLDDLYQLIETEQLNEFILHDMIFRLYENKLKIIHCYLSNELIKIFISGVNHCVSIKFDGIELIQFSKQILNNQYIEDGLKEQLKQIDLGKQNQDYTSASSFLLNQYLSSAYDYINSSLSYEQSYLGSAGEELKNEKIICIKEIFNYIEGQKLEIDSYAVSNVLDVLIDRGILIPTIVHKEGDIILRAYKSGEISRLTEEQIHLFAYMLGEYSNNKGDVLDRIELEKLCVLFFKEAIKNSIFTQASGFDDDCYGICYSKFGPRVSISDKKYTVNSDNTLITNMNNKDYVKVVHKMNPRNKGMDYKYNVNTMDYPYKDKARWKHFAGVFAYNFSILQKCFDTEDTLNQASNKEKRNTVRNQHVHTYNEFLTLMAIGNVKKNQLLSLIAELYFISKVDMNTVKANVILNQINKFIDGIESGMWKYTCFNKENLIEELYELAIMKNPTMAQFYLNYEKDEFDYNPMIAEYIDHCGELLFKMAYTFYYLYVKYTRKTSHRICNKRFFHYKKFSDLRHEIETRYSSEISEEEIINDLILIKNEATAYVNICDLYLDSAMLNVERYQSIFAIMNNDNQIPKELTNINQCIKLKSKNSNEGIVWQKCDEKLDIADQLADILSLLEGHEGVKIIVFHMRHWYEGIFNSRTQAVGDYFIKFSSSLIDKLNSYPKNPYHEIIFCDPREMVRGRIELSGYKLVETSGFDLMDNYCVSRCVISKSKRKGDNVMNINIQNNSGDIYNNTGEGVTVNKTIINFEHDLSNSEVLKRLYDELELIKKEVSGDQKSCELVEEAQNDVKKGEKSKIVGALKRLAEHTGDIIKNIGSCYLYDLMISNNIIK